ncbi:hypothetical protein [Streptomyces sp. CBMA29]|uniref:T4 family baseplate hub assembly chaperone n=1 Tax=Streptomyces sp. CBMA29 TaxID=1896314 RepID=UPI001661B2B5|nr:hypothetical protein [Streptomyces sp. CBMA29]MBD0734065.1 hypothetical protein [Streptomyces sp. CBMA29]
MTTRTEYDADFDTLGGDTISALERPEEATQASAAVLAADQVSGRPVIDAPPDTRVRLARGIRRDGVAHRDAEVRELTGTDEEMLARAGADWPRFLATLVERGTVHVGGEPMTADLAKELLIGDREALILAIRRATFGTDVEFTEYECPYCGESTDLTLHLDSVPYRGLAQEHDEHTVLLREGRTAIVRLPTAGDQDAVLGQASKLTAAEQNSEMLSRCVLRLPNAVGNSYQEGNREQVRDLGMADRRAILRYLDEAQPGPRYNEVSFKHDACGREVPLPISVAGLFL